MIEKGKEWGSPVVLAGIEPTAANDAELARLIDEAPHRRILLSGGDLYTSLGGQAPLEPIELPIDVLDVTADGQHYVAAAHVVVRRRLWRGTFLVGMNGTHLGNWNLGPKAHPNDGLVDITTGSLSLGDRWKAAKRAPAGAHVPHPALSVPRRRSYEHRFDRPTPLFVDNVAVGSVQDLAIVVRPDAASIVLI